MDANTATRKPAAIHRINAALKSAQRPERLTRCRAGYYYLRDGTVECSIYAYVLDATDGDFDYAADYINDAFIAAGMSAPIARTNARRSA